MEADSTSNLRRTVRKAENKHPGLLLKKRRRTKSEINQEKALKQMEKALKEKEMDDDILRIAQLEDRMAIEDANEESAHPRRREPRRQDGRATEGWVDRVTTNVDTTMSVLSQVKKTSPLGDGLSDLSDDESTDNSPPKKKGRKITRTYPLEAPILSTHEIPHAARPTRARLWDSMAELMPSKAKGTYDGDPIRSQVSSSVPSGASSSAPCQTVSAKRKHSSIRHSHESGMSQKKRTSDSLTDGLALLQNIVVQIHRAYTTPSPSMPPPPPASKLEASSRFFKYIKKCRQEGNEWLSRDDAFQLLQLFERDETACKLYIMYEANDAGLMRLWLQQQLEEIHERGAA